jgi:predicted RNase H-like HicB family nuclease
MTSANVQALWDADAGIWVAQSDDIPGLATGAATLDELVAKLAIMIPELLELNRPDLWPVGPLRVVF